MNWSCEEKERGGPGDTGLCLLYESIFVIFVVIFVMMILTIILTEMQMVEEETVQGLSKDCLPLGNLNP